LVPAREKLPPEIPDVPIVQFEVTRFITVVVPEASESKTGV